MTYTLITGASKGIGKAIASELASQGKNLLLVARSEELLEQLAGQLQAKNIDVRYMAVDLTEENAAQRVFDWIELQKIEVDTLVNNAGAGFYGKFMDGPIDKHIQIMHLNMDAMVAMAHEFLRRTNGSRRRYVLHTVSTAAFQPVPYMAIYSATKSFMLSFTRALRYEVKEQNVYVTALCPGATESEFSANAGTSALEKKHANFVMTSASVARAGINGLWKNKSVVIPGLMNKITTVAVNLTPQDLATMMSGNIFKNN